MARNRRSKTKIIYMLFKKMENKQIYRISLTDYACPGFYSGSKDYYGTMEDIVALISAIKFNKSIDYDIDGLVVALEKYQAGEIDCEHNVAYWKTPFLTEVKLIEQSELFEKSYNWRHVNIWKFPYYMRSKNAIFKQIVVEDGEKYIRAIKPEFEGLEYSLNKDFANSDKIGSMFWGFPEMIKYDVQTHKTFSRLYFIEESYLDAISACDDLHTNNKIDLHLFCDDIFGDG